LIIFFFLGLIAVYFILFFRSSIVSRISENNILLKWLQSSKWFQKSLLAGMFLFLINAVLFMSTMGILFGMMKFLIPYVHFVVMIAGVVVSIWLWSIINSACRSSNKGRIIMASVGSSFYFILTVLFVYMYATVEPYYPGEDTFMRALGLSLGGVVAAVACITCFAITGFSKQQRNLKYNSTIEAKNSQ